MLWTVGTKLSLYIYHNLGNLHPAVVQMYDPEKPCLLHMLHKTAYSLFAFCFAQTDLCSAKELGSQRECIMGSGNCGEATRCSSGAHTKSSWAPTRNQVNVARVAQSVLLDLIQGNM